MSLPRRQGRVLEGVREVLEDLDGREDVRWFLLTGNTPAGAKAKLTHYGLWEFFAEREGAFCVNDGPRTDIARRAVALAPDAEQCYVIGSSPPPTSRPEGRSPPGRSRSRPDGTRRMSWQRMIRGSCSERIPEPEVFRRLIGVA